MIVVENWFLKKLQESFVELDGGEQAPALKVTVKVQSSSEGHFLKGEPLDQESGHLGC